MITKATGTFVTVIDHMSDFHREERRAQCFHTLEYLGSYLIVLLEMFSFEMLPQ
jgi:hypothetical protein